MSGSTLTGFAHLADIEALPRKLWAARRLRRALRFILPASTVLELVTIQPTPH